jgi:hypothetical protein
LRQDATAGRGKPRPYKRNKETASDFGEGRASCLPLICLWDEVGRVEDDAGGDVVGGVFGVTEGGVVAVHGGDAAEEELANVGDGDGVEARDAFARELADEVAEKCVDGFWGRKVGEVAEEFVGVSIVETLASLTVLACVMGAEFRIGTRSGETALLAAAIHVAATIGGQKCGGHGSGSRCRFAGYRLAG